MSKNPEVDWGNAFADNSNRYCNDQLLRKHGFSIWKRPKVGQPTWLDKAGKEYLESDALASIKKEAGK